MVTPLAPTTESMTPCAKTLVAAKATRRIADEYCILIYVGGEKGRQLKIVCKVGYTENGDRHLAGNGIRRMKKVLKMIDADDEERSYSEWDRIGVLYIANLRVAKVGTKLDRSIPVLE